MEHFVSAHGDLCTMKAHMERWSKLPSSSSHSAEGDPFPLLVIFDDSLHNRWQDASTATANFSARQRAPIPCGASVRVEFGSNRHAFTLRTDEPVVLSNSVPLLLSFAFDTLCNEDGHANFCGLAYQMKIHLDDISDIYLLPCPTRDVIVISVSSLCISACAKHIQWVV